MLDVELLFTILLLSGQIFQRAFADFTAFVLANCSCKSLFLSIMAFIFFFKLLFGTNSLKLFPATNLTFVNECASDKLVRIISRCFLLNSSSQVTIKHSNRLHCGTAWNISTSVSRPNLFFCFFVLREVARKKKKKTNL